MVLFGSERYVAVWHKIAQVKGAVVVSASWSAADHAVHGVSLVARPEHTGPVLVLCSPALCQGEPYSTPKVKVQCEGVVAQPAATVKPLAAAAKRFALSFTLPAGTNCTLV